MTAAVRTAVWLVVAWLLAAVALLAADRMLITFLLVILPGSAVVLVLRALLRQQCAPSICDRPPTPGRYLVADDLTQPIVAVVEAAEAEA